MRIERERHEAILRLVGAHFILIEADFLLARFKSLFDGPPPAGDVDERGQRDAPRREHARNAPSPAPTRGRNDARTVATPLPAAAAPEPHSRAIRAPPHLPP